MINETLSLGVGECPVIRPEGIYFGGRRVIALDPNLSGLGSFGLGDVTDLLAYRREWEPFIAAHLELWRDLNRRFENSPDMTKCPPGIFKDSQIQSLDPVWRSWCAALALTRTQTSTTDPRGILPRWNAWKDKSSADIVAGASAMLAWHQDVVMGVGGPDKNKLVEIAKFWEIKIQLPDLPPLSTQQDIISRIQGAYIATKGVLQLFGYGAYDALVGTASVAQAVAQGLTDTAKEFPKTARWIGIAAGVAVAVVGGALIVYYIPRRSTPSAMSRT
jgi:hypothetical protein